MDFTETEPSIYFTRVCFQEVLQTFIFTFLFLAMRFDALFNKSSRMIKGLVLFHVLWACYALSLGAGACLNPAFGLAQSIYWLGLGETNNLLYNMSCLWIYTLMPFIGAAIAAALFQSHLAIS